MRDSQLPLGNAALTGTLRRFSDGICSISVAGASGPLTLTAASVVPISTSPPTVVCSAKIDYAVARAMHGHKRFAVNLLRDGPRHAGRPVPGELTRRASAPAWIVLDSGTPADADALLTLDCRLGRTVDSGGQMLVIGLVAWLWHGDASERARASTSTSTCDAPRSELASP